MGSAGECLNELVNVLHLPRNVTLLKSTFQSYMQLMNNSNINITTANNIFVAERFKLPKQYENVSKVFNARIQEINSSNPQATVKQINQWVENQTQNKIKDLVDDSIINSNTVMVLVNALYFNAHWKYPFDDTITHKRDFHANGKDKVKTNMMLQVGHFNYTNSKVLDAKVLELPYEDADYVMNIALPNDKNGLNGVTKNIGKLFKKLDFQEEEVSVMMPKFKFEDKNILNDVLKKVCIVLKKKAVLFMNYTLDGIEFNI